MASLENDAATIIENKTSDICTDEEEYKVLQQFSQVVSDLGQDDETLIRFLRARERDIPKAENMLRKCLKWREENNTESYLRWEPPKYLENEFKIKFMVSGKDYGGRPVFWIPIGSFLGRECIESGHKETMFQFLYHLLETGLQKIKESGKGQITAVLAIENLALRQILHVETMQTLYQCFQILEQMYPEILCHLISVNAPWMFSIAYNFVKPILSAHTISKIQVYNCDTQNWLKNILKIMPIEAVPEEYLSYEKTLRTKVSI